MINHRCCYMCFSALRYFPKTTVFFTQFSSQTAATLTERALVECDRVNPMHLYDIRVLGATFTIATLILPKHN